MGMETALHHKWILCNELTEHIDKGVGQEVAVVVGDIALEDGAGSSLHIGEDDGVVLHLSAEILRGICSWDNTGYRGSSLLSG